MTRCTPTALSIKASVALAGLLGLGLVSVASAAPVPIATYEFNNTLASNEAGKPNLVAIDPLGLSGFESANVFGVTKQVYRFTGTTDPAGQAGLTLKTAGLLSNSGYSVDIVFSFDGDDVTTWESILNAANRQSDNAFYVEPGHKLQIFPVGDGPDTWTYNEFHRVTMTKSDSGHVTAFLDGAFQFDLITNVMDFSTYGAANPDNLLTFFADNVVGGGIGEYMNGRVSLIRLYGEELTRDDVVDIGDTPTPSVPEPATLTLLAGGLVLLSSRRRVKA